MRVLLIIARVHFKFDKIPANYIKFLDSAICQWYDLCILPRFDVVLSANDSVRTPAPTGVADQYSRQGAGYLSCI